MHIATWVEDKSGHLSQTLTTESETHTGSFRNNVIN